MLGTSLGRTIVGEVGRFRHTLVERIRRVNAITEKEVMKTTSGLGKIVDLASRLSSETKATLARISGSSDDESLATAIAKQTEVTETFLDGFKKQIGEQRDLAARANAQSREILNAANAIEDLTKESGIIAINAMIEASRMGSQGAGFSVIAKEMQRLGAEVKKTNTMVSRLAKDLGALLPEIASVIEQTSNHAERFSSTIHESMTNVKQETTLLQNGVDQLIQNNEQVVHRILKESQDALSCLQFQDSTAQGLLRLDALAHNLQVEIGNLTGENVDTSELAAIEHEEIGGDKEVSPDNAGEVMLF